MEGWGLHGVWLEFSDFIRYTTARILYWQQRCYVLRCVGNAAHVCGTKEFLKTDVYALDPTTLNQHVNAPETAKINTSHRTQTRWTTPPHHLPTPKQPPTFPPSLPHPLNSNCSAHSSKRAKLTALLSSPCPHKNNSNDR